MKIAHIILRGGRKPNYDADNVAAAMEELKKPCCHHLMIDFSHCEQSQGYRRQAEVAVNVAEQIAAGSHAICGVMIESHLVEGNQKATVKNVRNWLRQSITDGCIGLTRPKRCCISLLKQLESVEKENNLSTCYG